jgi:transposase
MTEIAAIGLDLAKRVFQVHGTDAAGRPVMRRKLRRSQVLAFFAALEPCTVGLEACATAHHWAREIRVLGHEVRLIPPQYVKPFVKTNKNDVTDAEAICEALLRPTMRFAAVKSAEQQSVLMLHRARELLVRQRTMLINALRGHCAEFGLTAPQGASHVAELILRIEEEDDRLPPLARRALASLVAQIRTIQTEITGLEKELLTWHRTNEASQRLGAIPGVGVITATALVATVGDASQFRSARQFAAFLGLAPKQNSSGGRDRLGRISKRGDGYLRRLLVHGSRAVLRWTRLRPERRSPWLEGLLARRPTNVVLVAMANKMARIVWAMLSRSDTYQPTRPAAA